MYSPASPPPPAYTTRELTEWIDRLILNRIYDFAVSGLKLPDTERRELTAEDFECMKRHISDGFKSHSGAKGVYKG